MKLEDFDYNLPRELIAQEPVSPRDSSRLLVLDKKTGEIKHKNFFDIVDYLNPGDVLVMNNSKVFPARLLGKKADTGGKMEVFLHRHETGKEWQCLLGGRGAKVGLLIDFPQGVNCEVVKNNEDGTWQVKFNLAKNELLKKCEKIGLMPLPPYIKRIENKESRIKNDNVNYQTVYSDKKKVGSVAAPTAGLHFTPALLKKIKAKGIKIEYVTLHVGLGTFAPVKVDNVKKHKMHAEWVEIKKSSLEKIIQAKKKGSRVITVGTTSTRSLEAAFENIKISDSVLEIKPFRGWVDIFIYPGYNFKVVDALITNFHLPKSTLLMLVSALAGKKNIDKAYQEAVQNKYRFFSYGDAMFIV
jgi:S-adenosylmethionine:tRNA ribosyltransferase-isomerase